MRKIYTCKLRKSRPAAKLLLSFCFCVILIIQTNTAGSHRRGDQVWKPKISNTKDLRITTVKNKKETNKTGFQQAAADLISNVTAATGRSYSVSALTVGTFFYTDRNYAITILPSYLNGAALVKTPNDDKSQSGAAVLSFGLSQSATVYVAYDPRSVRIPSWLTGWQKLADVVNINDPRNNYMVLYSKVYPAGTVTLGGNLANPAAGAQSNYFVFAVASQYSLAAFTNGSGSIIKNPDQASYQSGTSVSLLAMPAAGQQFSGWSGDASGIANPFTIIMDANKSVTAYFAPLPVDYSLNVTIDGNGTVTTSPNQATYPAGTTVNLTATPFAGELFTGWSGDTSGTANPLTLTMNTNKLVTATFAPGTIQSIFFGQSSQTAEVEQGGSQSLLEYISTSDNIPVNAQLTAVDDAGNIPTWLTVNGNILNGFNYTTNSEISFDFDATNLSIGSYPAVINASAPGYNNAVLDILLTVKAGSGGLLTNIKVNFQDSLTVPPDGWLRDFGQSYGPRTSLYQGSGLSYGWINRSDNTPLDLTKNSRKRTTPPDILSATLMHMQANNLPATFPGTRIEGLWEAQVANGNYDVTLSVGDGSYIDSKHSINVEGVNAISAFVPTTAVKFKTATVTVSVADGFLTIDAIGGVNTKINYVIIQPSVSRRPSVIAVNPENSSQNVSEYTSISTSILKLPNAGIDNSTITSANVYLTEESTGAIVPSNVNGTGGGDAITLVPSLPLKLSVKYDFNITSGVKDLSGASFIPYASSFTTGSVSTSEIINVKFDKIDLPNATGRHSSLTMGPDKKLYALGIDGLITRFAINSDGTLATPDTLYSLQDEYGTRQPCLAIGFAFDPSATATNLVAWVTHSTFVFLSGPQFDGKLSRLSGNNLQTVQDVLVNLPRSAKDHVTNSVAFGPDGALYFTQGSTSAMGRADNTWSNRNEPLMSAAVLRLDVSKLGALPLNVKTADGGGTYNPYAANAPLTIYASGVRNAFDLVWHSNGNLYCPTNGSAAGGNTPASVNGTLRTDGSTYNGPVIPALTNVQQTQKDFLFRIVKGGYYGHPNPLRGEYVMNGGNPGSSIDPAQVNDYPVGTLPDINWRGYSFDFQNNASPDGAIEYKSNTFNGALKGKLLVVRYSQHDDIITLTPGGANNDIISSTEGISIPGFSGFTDPLDLTEDTSTGNLYVSEYGGNGKIVLLRVNNTIQPVSPYDDAFTRSATYSDINYGSDTSLYVKGTSVVGFTRVSYLKFPLYSNLTNISSAKLRLYGRNTEDNTSINVSVFGMDNDSWTENAITFNNAPASLPTPLSTTGVNGQSNYYEFDVTDFVKTQLTGDKTASFLVKDLTNANRKVEFNSKEKGQNEPQLLLVAADNSAGLKTNVVPISPDTVALHDPGVHGKNGSIGKTIGLMQEGSDLFSMEETYRPEHNFEKPGVYPNPLHNKFTIEFPRKYQGNYNIGITDLLGRTYQIANTRLNIGGSNMEVNVSKLQLKPGVYFLKIHPDNGNTEVIKLVLR